MILFFQSKLCLIMSKQDNFWLIASVSILITMSTFFNKSRDKLTVHSQDQNTMENLSEIIAILPESWN